MSRLTRGWRQLFLSILLVTLLAPVAAAQSDAVAFRPACQLADDAAASAALGLDVVGDDSLSNLYCTYMAGDTMVAMAALTPDMSLDLARMAFPDATDLTIAGSQAIASPGDAENGTPPTVLVALEGGGALMVNVMPEAGVADPLAAATALAEALLASGPATATLPEEVTGPAIEFVGDPCAIVSLDEMGGIMGATFTTAEPDGTGGCTYQTDIADGLVAVSLAFSDGTLAPLRSGSTSDLTIADRTAVFWPDLGTVFVDAGGGRLFSVMILSMTATDEGAPDQTQAQAAAIAELAVGRMTPAAG
jgi:hypothetical protein